MESSKMHAIPVWLRIIIFMGLLYLFFVAIGLMGGAFKLLGRDVAEALIAATSNPLSGLVIGILATSIVQSSSVTTSTVVGLVSAGALTIGNAVPIIMGANIGTSVTNTVVSLGHIRNREEFQRAFAGATVHDMFNLLAVFILLPLEIIFGFLERFGTGMAHAFTGSGGLEFTSPLKAITKPTINAIKHLFLDGLQMPEVATGTIMIVMAFALLFFALAFIVKTMKSLMLSRLEVAIEKMFGANPIFAIITGMIITAVVQSSSITTSLIVPLIGAGVMSLETAFPITIGANIGTTITALLAALAGNVNGLAIAFVHLGFNLAGTLILYPYKRIREIPLKMAQKLAEAATKDKKIALAFIVGVFYIIPLGGYGISKALGY